MARAQQDGQGRVYCIRVAGTLDEGWSAWFDGLTMSTLDNGDTMLSGPVRDQAALHGLLNKVRDMGLTLLCLEHTGRPRA
jgi:hypothetical protein